MSFFNHGRRYVRFSLRRLLIVAPCIALGFGMLGVWLLRSWEQRGAVSDLRQSGDEVYYGEGILSRATGDLGRGIEEETIVRDFVTNVGVVHFQGGRLNTARVNAVEKLRDVRGVWLSGIHVDKQAFDRILKLDGLSVLELHNARLEADCYLSLNGANSLRVLSLSGSNATDGFVMELRPSLRITSLIIPDGALSRCSIRQISELRSLKRLNLQGVSVQEDDLHWLMRLNKLRVLKLYGIGDCGLKQVILVPELEELWLTDATISEGCVEEVLHTAKLKRLILFGGGISSSQANSLDAQFPDCVVVKFSDDQ